MHRASIANAGLLYRFLHIPLIANGFAIYCKNNIVLQHARCAGGAARKHAGNQDAALGGQVHRGDYCCRNGAIAYTQPWPFAGQSVGFAIHNYFAGNAPHSVYGQCKAKANAAAVGAGAKDGRVDAN
jgi:hypothetical protein